MPYVPVPKDLTKVKTKLAFNLTKRQLICFSLAGLVGLPVYFFTRGAIGNSAAVLLMIGLMMPFFFFAMYERDGQPAEKILKNRLRYKLWPKDRPYRTVTLFVRSRKSQIRVNQTLKPVYIGRALFYLNRSTPNTKIFLISVYICR